MTSPKDERSELVEDLVSRIARGELERQRGSFGPFDSLSAFCAWLRRRRISSIIHEGREVMTVEVDEGGSPDPDCQQAADMLASLEPQAGMVTDAMVEAGRKAALEHYRSAPISDQAYRAIYKAMSAALTPSEQGSGLREALEEARGHLMNAMDDGGWLESAQKIVLAKIDDALGAS